MVAPLFEFAGHFWWLIFPFMGVIGGGVKAVAAANERRAQRRLERYRIKQETKVALATAAGRASENVATYRREMTKVMQRHLLVSDRETLMVTFERRVPESERAARAARCIDDVIAAEEQAKRAGRKAVAGAAGAVRRDCRRHDDARVAHPVERAVAGHCQRCGVARQDVLPGPGARSHPAAAGRPAPVTSRR